MGVARRNRAACGVALQVQRRKRRELTQPNDLLRSHPIFHPPRRSRASILLASSSSNRLVRAFHFRLLPVRIAMFPMWQTITDPAPTVTLQIGSCRLATQSRKLPMWFVGRVG